MHWFCWTWKADQYVVAFRSDYGLISENAYSPTLPTAIALAEATGIGPGTASKGPIQRPLTWSAI